MRSRAAVRGLAPLVLAALLGCSSSGPSDPGGPLGDAGGDAELWKGDAPALHDAAVLGEAFAVARHVLFAQDEPAPSTALRTLPGRRVFVCAYQDDPRQRCASGVGDDLRGSVEAAARGLKAKAARDLPPDRKDAVILKLDVVTKTSGQTFGTAIEKPQQRDVGTYGYWVRDAQGQASWILPSEVLERGLFDDGRRVRGIPRKDVLKTLRRRNPSLGALAEEFAYTRLHTVAWIEGDNGGQGPRPVFRLYRTHKADFDTLTADLLLQRIVWAADHLISSVSKDGKIRYIYRPVTDKTSSSYNLLRHGGTTYSILQAYDRTRHEPYLLAAKKAFEYLFARCDRDVRQGPKGPFGADAGESMFVVSPGDKIKLGGAGLALVAIDQYVEATGDKQTYREEALGFARFLVSSLKEDGEFIYFPSRHPGGPPTSKDGSAYYPGEAILGLVRLYSWDPNPLWLQTAVDAADWLIDVRDKGKDGRRLANDHWLMLALSYLYHYTGDARYLTHSMNLADAVEYQYEKNRPTWKKHPDYQGGYYDPPRSTPAATRGEGLGAVLDTCVVAKTECPKVRFLLEETVRHENLSQYDPDTTYWMTDRATSFGGWNGGLMDTEIRNDFVQHNMSALLGLERHMRLEAGEVLAGGPGWTEKALAGTTGWTGLPPERMTALKEATLRFRGPSRWEKLAADLVDSVD